MIDTTERQIAEKKTNLIKAELASSGVDYYLCETPYTVSIQIKKKLIKDNSAKSQINEIFTAANSIKNNPSLVSSLFLNSSSPLFQRSSNANGSPDDSGIVDGDFSGESEAKLNESKKKELETIITSKDSILKQLKQKLKTTEEENSKIKAEIKVKNDQLKQKNKLIEKYKYDLENEKEERAANNSNYSNKISNLENKINYLNKSVDEKNLIIKEEKKKLKNANIKKKSKDQSSETENIDVLKTSTNSLSTQTYIKKKDVGTSPIFTKLYIEGDPSHDVTCVCVCHEGNEGKCEVQLFKYTNDSEVALDSLYYREEYDDWIDDDSYNDTSEDLKASKNVVESLLNMKSRLDEDEYMKEMIKSALDSWIVDKRLENEAN